MQTKLWFVWLFAARKVAAQVGERDEASSTIPTTATAEPEDTIDESTSATNSTAPATQAISSTTTPLDTSGLSIYQIVKRTKDLWLLSAAIDAALVDTALTGRCGCGLRTSNQFTDLRMSKPATSTEYGPFTLFAPVDDALFALPSGLYSKLTKEPIWM